jgi:hypothetical protein
MTRSRRLLEYAFGIALMGLAGLALVGLALLALSLLPVLVVAFPMTLGAIAIVIAVALLRRRFGRRG